MRPPLVVTRHFVELAAFFVQAEPPACFLCGVILDGKAHDCTQPGEEYVIAAMMARSRSPTTVEPSITLFPEFLECRHTRVA
jgi:hypothetical protein